MNNQLIVPIITVSGSIIAAAVMFDLTKRHERWANWQQQKLDHYKALLSALSDLAVDGHDLRVANDKFALAVNMISLVAPQDVITALMDFHDEVAFTNPGKTPEKHDALLKKLLLAIRRDIGLSAKDDPTTFTFHFIGSKPPSGYRR